MHGRRREEGRTMEWTLWVVIIIVAAIWLWWWLRSRDAASDTTMRSGRPSAGTRRDAVGHQTDSSNPLAHMTYDDYDRDFLRQAEERHRHDEDSGSGSSTTTGPSADHSSGETTDSTQSRDLSSRDPEDSEPDVGLTGSGAEASGTSMRPPEDSAPPGHIIKGEARTRTFYRPGSPGFAHARADAWFRTVEEAEAAGYKDEGA